MEPQITKIDVQLAWSQNRKNPSKRKALNLVSPLYLRGNLKEKRKGQPSRKTELDPQKWRVDGERSDPTPGEPGEKTLPIQGSTRCFDAS